MSKNSKMNTEEKKIRRKIGAPRVVAGAVTEVAAGVEERKDPEAGTGKKKRKRKTRRKINVRRRRVR